MCSSVEAHPCRRSQIGVCSQHDLRQARSSISGPNDGPHIVPLIHSPIAFRFVSIPHSGTNPICDRPTPVAAKSTRSPIRINERAASLAPCPGLAERHASGIRCPRSSTTCCHVRALDSSRVGPHRVRQPLARRDRISNHFSAYAASQETPRYAVVIQIFARSPRSSYRRYRVGPIPGPVIHILRLDASPDNAAAKRTAIYWYTARWG